MTSWIRDRSGVGDLGTCVTPQDDPQSSTHGLLARCRARDAAGKSFQSTGEAETKACNDFSGIWVVMDARPQGNSENISKASGGSGNAVLWPI